MTNIPGAKVVDELSLEQLQSNFLITAMWERWHDKTPEEIVHEFVVIRGDLTEANAQLILSKIIQFKINQASRGPRPVTTALNGTSFIDGYCPTAHSVEFMTRLKPGSKFLATSDGSVWRATPYCGSEGTFHYRSHFATMLPQELLDKYGRNLRLIWEQS